MIRRWRLTRQAEDSLAEIADWTYATFGTRQAEAYAADLIGTCREVAAGHAITRPCRHLAGSGVPEDLRYVRCGQHYVVFVEAPDQISIVDFLHVRVDLPGKLAALQGPEPGT
mgnify:CR=1 FL=1